jgi:phospholipase C
MSRRCQPTRLTYVAAAAVALVACGGGVSPSLPPSPSTVAATESDRRAMRGPAFKAIPGSSPIKHVVIVLQENRTFDNLFHGYPGANWARFGYNHENRRVALPELRLMTPWDPSHEYEDWLIEYDGGKMNGFDLETVDEGHRPPKDFAYGYARPADVKPYWELAREGVLGDEMFDDHRSQTYAGHLYVIAGAAGPIAAGQRDWYVADNPLGGTSCANEGMGEAINISTGETNENYTTCFDFPTIGDRLTRRGISWRYYVPFTDRETIVSGYASIRHVFDGPQWANVVSPETTIFSDIDNGTLPAVSWVIATFANSDHPGQDVPSSNGPNWVANVFNAVGTSRYWKDTAIILTYDDWGGWFDHVKPATFDYYEPGFRLPLVIVSPYARRGYVSHDVHYTGSILHFIEHVYGLRSLGTSDRRSDRFDDCFDFSQKPLPYVLVPPPGNFASLFESNLAPYDGAPADPALRD